MPGGSLGEGTSVRGPAGRLSRRKMAGIAVPGGGFIGKNRACGFAGQWESMKTSGRKRGGKEEGLRREKGMDQRRGGVMPGDGCCKESDSVSVARYLLEHFQFETLRVSNHTACRFAEKTRFFRSLWAGRRCAAASRFTFFKVETL